MVELEGVNGHPGDPFEIISCRLGDGIVLVVSGDIDIATASRVEHELLRAEAHDLVVLDLSRLSFMDSTGLHLILAADRRIRERGGRLLIVQGPPQIRRLFELTRVADHLELIQDAAELERAAAAWR
jgi:anti-sigma B factor antagonist